MVRMAAGVITATARIDDVMERSQAVTPVPLPPSTRHPLPASAGMAFLPRFAPGLHLSMIEALRCGIDTSSPPGLARGLADERLAVALRAMHARPEHSWTVGNLAKDAALSRSAFFARFARTVGMAPMEYLLTWRMALAKRKLRERDQSVEDIAESVGYSSASTFNIAFTRHVSISPARYARMQIKAHGSSVLVDASNP